MNEISCKVVLDSAAAADLQDVLVIGVQKDGELHIASSGEFDIAQSFLLMERAKLRLLAIYEQAERDRHA